MKQNITEMRQKCGLKGDLQVLRIAVGSFPEKSFTKVYGSTLQALRGGGCVGVNFPEQNVTQHLNKKDDENILDREDNKFR